MESGTLLLVHAAATWFMTGLIWFVQIVHYPLLYDLDQGAHQSKTSYVVGPPMIIEALTAATILYLHPSATTAAGFALLTLIWASTAFVQVPLHNQLLTAPTPQTHARLVQTNWVRTLAWSARAILVFTAASLGARS